MANLHRDPSGMAFALAAIGSQLRAGAGAGHAAGASLSRPRAVVLAGMGGSAIAGELLRALVADRCPVPVTRTRGPRLPGFIDASTLVVLTSYSGETEETLACARQARAAGARTLVVSSGGELARLADEWGAAIARVPGGLPPRAALGYLFGATAAALAAAGLAPGSLVDDAIAGAGLADRPAALALGRHLAHRTPLVYGGGPLAAVAYRWKTQLNENAKMHAFAHALPEMGHNEIVGWDGPAAAAGAFSAVLLADPTDAHGLRRLAATADLLDERGADVVRLPARGATAAARAFHMVATGDWASYGAALERGVDPTPIAAIDELKARLAA